MQYGLIQQQYVIANNFAHPVNSLRSCVRDNQNYLSLRLLLREAGVLLTISFPEQLEEKP